MNLVAEKSNRSQVTVWVALLLLLIGAMSAYQIVGLNQALLLLIGGALGMTLYHASFGFTFSWRVFIKERRGRGLRAQMIMLALAVLLFFPALGAGQLFGQPVTGFVSPLSTSVVIGAFIFGIGWGIAGICPAPALTLIGLGHFEALYFIVAMLVGMFIFRILNKGN